MGRGPSIVGQLYGRKGVVSTFVGVDRYQNNCDVRFGMCRRRVPDGGVLRKLVSNFNLIAYFILLCVRGRVPMTSRFTIQKHSKR